MPKQIRVADDPRQRKRLPERIRKQKRTVERGRFRNIIDELEEIKQHVASLERLVLDIGEAARDAIEEPSDEPEV